MAVINTKCIASKFTHKLSQKAIKLAAKMFIKFNMLPCKCKQRLIQYIFFEFYEANWMCICMKMLFQDILVFMLSY